MKIYRQLFAAVFVVLWASLARADMAEVALNIGAHTLTAEVARSDPERMTGLMHRRMLPENRGMLFIFPDVAMHGMWMMNTYVPLSVAFLDSSGVIINIEDMHPLTQTTHSAARPAKYALEMNRGWFKKRGIKPGAKVDGIDRAGAAR